MKEIILLNDIIWLQNHDSLHKWSQVMFSHLNLPKKLLLLSLTSINSIATF